MAAKDRLRRGVVLLAALAFLAFLAVIVTGMLERLPLVSAESRSGARVVQRELDVNSALEFAIGILRADAAENDCDGFSDLWVRPHSVSMGELEIEVKLADRVFSRVPEDEWARYQFGVPDGVSMVESEDPYVHEVLEGARPNLNTAPIGVLQRASGLSAEAVAWVRKTREEQPFAELDDFREAPDYGGERYGRMLEGISLRSTIFVAEATIRRAGEPERKHWWVLERQGSAVNVVYANSGDEAR